ncbi:urease accessory protein [Rhodovulum sp. ES.010]|uniref:urease accessory protein UreE n=1 Tax=Rhodovulum sp. ES.010 TaxID=1882821 RepID=UPI00092A69E9|nr:urease accessory protein UreE [Rhodovulum sp. ES.010]SIO41507.1 urease accessory protein [Rhodovulum sp. ES.010]
MSTLPVARSLLAGGSGAVDTVTLGYDARFLRRKRLVTDGGLAFVLDLPKTTSLNAGDLICLEDGRAIAVRAAAEPLLCVTGDHLPRIAWHIGNRHTPCQIEPGRLLIQRDHVIRDMLEKIGATVTEVEEPFTPEGGAYGHGRTHSHSHGHDHAHGDGHAHDHHHDHGH